VGKWNGKLYVRPLNLCDALIKGYFALSKQQTGAEWCLQTNKIYIGATPLQLNDSVIVHSVGKLIE